MAMMLPRRPESRPTKALSIVTQATMLPARPTVGAHDAELDDALHGRHEHRVGDADAADQEGQADGQAEKSSSLPMMLPTWTLNCDMVRN